jgi:hydrogenase maturation protein HypF
VLGGGVFQNRQLLELLSTAWNDCDQPLGMPGRIPPNDGGLAAGQLTVALAKLDAGEQPLCA